ncbi:Uma2 family endonuclease [Lewinella sp. 4G2]|uniref:Uma2 family endonuclease n=1 Tax=Lewinella sp. 4G2 TaxID=1803372 RepID=UPI0007B4DB5B|nr:Uma2 family endonuclease [Lewinella sp. 4G2]OAV44913.1 hypothetical protein A3850_010595 [Lewinella sp. 4G2]
MTALPMQSVAPRDINLGALGIQPFKITLERYTALIDAGFLDENDKVELIFGQLVEIMPVGKKHGDCIDDLNDFFTPQYFKTHRCRVQNPVNLAHNSQPEPDFALINRASYAQRDGNPIVDDIDLLIEVSDSTLSFDRTIKTNLYAYSGVNEYWIVNLVENVIEVHLSPDLKSGLYNSVSRFGLEEQFESPFCGRVSVKELIKL